MSTDQKQQEDELTFAQSVAEAVIALLERGHTDPTTEEIADEYFNQPVVRAIESEVQDRLPYICKLVRDTFPRAHLVCDAYYNAFQERLPQDIETAERCLPMGQGREGVGIRIPQVEDDQIHLAYMRHNLKCAIGKRTQNVQTLKAAYLNEDITGEAVIEILREYDRLTDSLEGLAKLLRARDAVKGPLFESTPHGDGLPAPEGNFK